MFSKNISPKISSLSAVAVGYLLLDDLSASEQNALGNWLMLVAQVLSTNAYFKQLQSEYQNEKSNNYKMASEVDILKRMKDALEKERFCRFFSFRVLSGTNIIMYRPVVAGHYMNWIRRSGKRSPAESRLRSCRST